MAMVVGVHGIFQEQLGRNQLLKDWEPAYSDGLAMAGVVDSHVPSFDLAYYGDLYLPDEAQGVPVFKNRRRVTEEDLIASDTVDDDEMSFLQAAAAEAVEDRPDLGDPMGITTVSPIFQPLVKALTRRFDGRLVLPFITALRQVRLYQKDPELADQIRARVVDKVKDGCRVLIGHSLGSVVAFETLVLHPELKVDTLVTVGSPLSMKTVAKGLRPYSDKPGEAPRGNGAGQWQSKPPLPLPCQVRRWVNIFDPSDPVAGAGFAGRLWPSTEDVGVQNGDLPHAIVRYLSKRSTGKVIVEGTRIAK